MYIRRVGMQRNEKYVWNKNIKMSLLVLRTLGLWPMGDEPYKPGLYLVYSRIMAALFAVLNVLSHVVNIYFVRDNLELVVGIIYILLIEFMGSFKVYYVIKNMKFLKNHMIFLQSEWFQPKNASQRVLIDKNITFWKINYRVLVTMCVACNTFWAIYPLVDKSSEERRLPFLAWYPYDSKISPLYEITYVFQVMGVVYLTMVNLNVDMLIVCFNVYSGCQFDMLSDNLRSLVDTNCDVHRNLVTCVFHHRQILSFVKGYSQCFKWVLFWHLIMSGVSIGITMFQLTLVVPLSNEFYSLVSYGTAITVEIFMYCYFGNEVQVKSNLVSYAVFESDWTDLPEEEKKKLLFFTIKLLKPLKISAFNIFELSLDTFMRILKTAWSYFALLYHLGSRN